MNFRIFALLIIGLALALVAGFASYSYMRGLEDSLAERERLLASFGESAEVPVPRRAIRSGESLTPEMFTGLRVPVRYLPGNVLKSLPATEATAGLQALTDLSPGDLLLATQIGTSQGPDNGISLSPGGRAVRITPVNFADFGGLLVPGAQLDIFWTRSLGGGTTDTRLIGHALTILEVGSAEAGSITPAGGSWVTLEAGLTDAARLLEARGGGRFHILPVGRLKDVPGEPPQVSVGAEDLIALPLVTRRGDLSAASLMAGAASVLQSSSCHTAVVRGANRSVVEVPC